MNYRLHFPREVTKYGPGATSFSGLLDLTWGNGPVQITNRETITVKIFVVKQKLLKPFIIKLIQILAVLDLFT